MKLSCVMCRKILKDEDVGNSSDVYRFYCGDCRDKNYNKIYYIFNKPEIARRNKEWARNNPEKVRKKWRKWVKLNRKHFNQLMMNSYERHKDRWRARAAAQKIKIPKNMPCQICHKRKAIERKHLDYSRPLKIIFVCMQCNRKRDFKS